MSWDSSLFSYGGGGVGKIASCLLLYSFLAIKKAPAAINAIAAITPNEMPAIAPLLIDEPETACDDVGDVVEEEPVDELVSC